MTLSILPPTIFPEDQSLAALTNHYKNAKTLPEIWLETAQQFGDLVALEAPHQQPAVSLTYRQMADQIQQFASGLQALGVMPGDCISLFSDNSPRWFIADQGTMAAGAANAVRSSQADVDELAYILENSQSTTLIVDEQKTLSHLTPAIQAQALNRVIILSDERVEAPEGVTALNFVQLIEQGQAHDFVAPTLTQDSLATLIYTSGTTGRPKGAMLSHGNLLHQVNALRAIVAPQPGDRLLSILPSWHAYERSVEYYALSQGCTQFYTNQRYIKKDLQTVKPNFLVVVPRLLEFIYEGFVKEIRKQPPRRQQFANQLLDLSQQYVLQQRVAKGLSLDANLSGSQKVLAQLQATVLAPAYALADKILFKKFRAAVGGEIKQMISGGGALATATENFYDMARVEILEGYGLTETAPVLTARRIWANRRGSAGKPIPKTEIRIVDPNTRETVPLGEVGLVWVRGPQVMQGYFNNPEATAKAIDAEGWFNTEDLGRLTAEQDLILTGRAKDTIVLSNGENVEPGPIEDACLRSPYIDQIVLVGQDQRSLGALIVPNVDALQAWGQEKSLNLPTEVPDLLANEAVQQLMRRELTREVANRKVVNPNDRIGPFHLLAEPFSPQDGTMTQTLKIKRPIVLQRYDSLIKDMFKVT